MATNALLHRAVSVFSNRQDAEAALHRLKDAGFNMNKVSIVAKNKDTENQLSEVTTANTWKEQPRSNAGMGVTAGAATGGAIGLFGTLAVVTVPGGAAVEAGMVLANTILGAAIGAAGAGLVEALINWGVPEDRANYYKNRVYEHHDYLIMVEGSDRDISNAKAILNDYNFQNWYAYDASDLLMAHPD